MSEVQILSPRPISISVLDLLEIQESILGSIWGPKYDTKPGRPWIRCSLCWSYVRSPHQNSDVFPLFSEGIDRCRAATTFKAADWEDAYNRLSRLRDRYLHEKDNRQLDPVEEQALRKVFEEDTLIKDMLKVRQIGEHVYQDNDTVRLLTNSTIPICVETSALGCFWCIYRQDPRSYRANPLHQPLTTSQRNREQNQACTRPRDEEIALKQDSIVLQFTRISLPKLLASHRFDGRCYECMGGPLHRRCNCSLGGT